MMQILFKARKEERKMGWEERGMVGSEAFFASVSPSLKRIRFREERDEWAETDVRLLTFLVKYVVKFTGLSRNKLNIIL